MRIQQPIFVRSIFFGLAAGVVSACGAEAPAPSDHAHLSQLTRVDHACTEWSEERVDAVTSHIPEGFLTEWQPGNMDRVHQALAGIPDSYMSWLYQVRSENGFYIAGRSPGFTGGVTMLDDERPYYIHVYPENYVIDLSLQHEVGHALYPKIKRVKDDAPAFVSELAQIADAEYSNPELNPYPRGYPVGSDAYREEFFAEAFNSYYCSKDTNVMVKEQFPRVFAFLAEHLETPVWE